MLHAPRRYSLTDAFAAKPAAKKLSIIAVSLDKYCLHEGCYVAPGIGFGLSKKLNHLDFSCKF